MFWNHQSSAPVLQFGIAWKPMEDAAAGIALSWDADRRAAGWIDKPFIERFLSVLPSGATVLDLGCGGGSPVALHVVAQGFRVTGVDSSPTLISLCRTRLPDQEWIVGDMRSLVLGGDLATYWLGIASFISGTRTNGRCLAFLPCTPRQALF
jgi:SAM-dependent methyltransferase